MSMATNRTSTERSGFRLTGLGFLLILVAFFGIDFIVNGVMVHYALSTFSGEVNPHPYKAGLAYNQEIAAARAQDQLHWQVSATVKRDPAGIAHVSVEARDAKGAPLNDLTVAVALNSPTDMKLDQKIRLANDGNGHYIGQLPLAAARWDVILTAEHSGKLAFESRNRITVD